ncbi:hypothetical protein NW766_004529 [Fusarium irregulare]|uniref:Uncharacterized protein n=1 Tax=Fusarium irregulare TaxID=2494466 RepID=A0A9W8PRU5_9HYPO|nr:hypothetical protein NW766_004529 [Fusarium irregulare]
MCGNRAKAELLLIQAMTLDTDDRLVPSVGPSRILSPTRPPNPGHARRSSRRRNPSNPPAPGIRSPSRGRRRNPPSPPGSRIRSPSPNSPSRSPRSRSPPTPPIRSPSPG